MLQAAFGRRKKSLRLGAFAWYLIKRGDKHALEEYYSDCSRCPHDDHERQADYRCGLISESQWNNRGHHLAVWMGGHGTPNDPWPAEPHDEGCPGSWYRCDWYRSVMRYKGPHGRVVKDPLILNALEYLEEQEARAREARTS